MPTTRQSERLTGKIELLRVKPRFDETFQSNRHPQPSPNIPICRKQLDGDLKSKASLRPSCSKQRGASADRHETWAQDAVDATVPGAFSALNDRHMLRTAKSCGPDAPWLASSLARRSGKVTVTNKVMDTGESTKQR
jgi:hypothetical protein